MDVQEHSRKFKEIIKKYGLDKKAEEISQYLVKDKVNKVSVEEFANKFGMTQEDAEIFISFVQKGLQWRENNTMGS